MIYNIKIAQKVAKSLLQINAIILQPRTPFTWASGWKSPIYCDNRKTLSFPKIRTYIKESLAQIVKDHQKDINIIAGVATAGIPHGSLLAEYINIPFIYARATAKEHGKKNKIEGYFEKGQSVILVEDLISSGMSSIDAANTLKKAGLKVKGVISIFTYGFETATENFKNADLEYLSLCDYNTLLPEAIKQGYIQKDDLPILELWREKPSSWKKIKI